MAKRTANIDLPDKSFAELQRDFNKAASNWAQEESPAELIMTRYDLLMKHRAETDEQKRELTHKLFYATMEAMKTVVDLEAKSSLNDIYATIVTEPFEHILSAENRTYAPAYAARDLTNLALMVLDDTEDSDRSDDNKKTFADFARKAMEYAERFEALKMETNPQVQTSQDISPAKRIELKAPANG
ncbi:MAG: hypothetical protein ACAH80_12455 [Alphaproteobacteria bacterium]